ncbi:MAG: protein kinase [Anaerolineae bacterium]|nr:protein kinase [Anaerolineae bacterium]
MAISGDPLVGKTIGRYEVLSVLGGGGMGTVYRARSPVFNREVAVKVINLDLQASEQFIMRFRREAEAVAALEHPHIITIYDFGQQDNLAYLVMAAKDGGNLGTLIRRQRLPLPEIARLVGQIASALDYAHQRNIIHRDLKPANILLDEDRNTFLTDFGIARRLGETKLTAQGMVVGSPVYMAPEAWRGEEPGPETDVYSLGVILFEMLVGQAPFVDKAPARLMLKHIQEPAPSVLAMRPDLPPLMDTIINQALTKERERRFRSAGQLASTLRAVITEPKRRQALEESGEDTTIMSSPTAIRKPPGEPDSAGAIPDASPRRAEEGAEPEARPARAGLPRWLLPAAGLLALLVILAIILLVTR